MVIALAFSFALSSSACCGGFQVCFPVQDKSTLVLVFWHFALAVLVHIGGVSGCVRFGHFHGMDVGHCDTGMRTGGPDHLDTFAEDMVFCLCTICTLRRIETTVQSSHLALESRTLENKCLSRKVTTHCRTKVSRWSLVLSTGYPARPEFVREVGKYGLISFPINVPFVSWEMELLVGPSSLRALP
jgi:hypothetical protein